MEKKPFQIPKWTFVLQNAKYQSTNFKNYFSKLLLKEVTQHSHTNPSFESIHATIISNEGLVASKTTPRNVRIHRLSSIQIQTLLNSSNTPP